MDSILKQIQAPHLNFIDLDINALRDKNGFFEIANQIFENVINNTLHLIKWFEETQKPITIEQKNKYVILGLLVRTYKLKQAFADLHQISYGEIGILIYRCCLETQINLEYILRNDHQEETIEKYLRCSYFRDKQLLNIIQENIAKRKEQQVLPIEERMIKSINRVFSLLNLRPEDITKNDKRWFPNIKARASDIGLPENLQFENLEILNQNMHGNWLDLKQFHLKTVQEGVFKPNMGMCHIADISPFIFLSLMSFANMISLLNIFTDESHQKLHEEIKDELHKTALFLNDLNLRYESLCVDDINFSKS